MRTIDKKILLVDDEKDVLKVIGKRLTMAGYTIVSASEGKTALKILEKELPDLILLDITMPDMDGIEVCSRIKKHTLMSNIPIIFFTARDSMQDKVRGLKKGVHDYITKPINHRELLARIEAVLKISKYYNEISLKDELTGLYNYNFFERHFTHMFNVAKRYKRVFSLLIVDIDDFKKINDRYGHLCGNYVLRKVGEKLKGSLRETDILARYGGDEFALILPETDHRQAAEVLKKLGKKVRKNHITYQGHHLEVTVSFGLSSFSEETKTREDFFNRADREMYKDKKRRY